jgi:hypothetical protein
VPERWNESQRRWILNFLSFSRVFEGCSTVRYLTARGILNGPCSAPCLSNIECRSRVHTSLRVQKPGRFIGAS